MSWPVGLQGLVGGRANPRTGAGLPATEQPGPESPGHEPERASRRRDVAALGSAHDGGQEGIPGGVRRLDREGLEVVLRDSAQESGFKVVAQTSEGHSGGGGDSGRVRSWGWLGGGLLVVDC